jgi:hypothetical protein
MKCEWCGVEFEVSKGRKESGPNKQRFHSRRCQELWRKASIGLCICEGCGIEFKPQNTDRKRFHSRECAFRFKHDSGERKRVIRALISKLRAIKDCKICGERTFNAYCSRECELEYGRRRSHEHSISKCDKDIIRCYQCGKEFKPEYGNKRTRFCSDRCSKRFDGRNEKRKRRMRKYKTEYMFDRFSDWEIFERDDWCCMICGLPVRKDAVGLLNNQAPTIDHIIPLSQGGTHRRDNVQCAHRICNSIKSDKSMQVIITQMHTGGASYLQP